MPPSIPRIPFTVPFPSPTIYPVEATSISNATTALVSFLISSFAQGGTYRRPTLLITGAGVSVASGLSDYRGEHGTYRVNRQYRPIFYDEFISSHESRKRYWARNFFGWPMLEQAKPNLAHVAIGKLVQLGLISGVITQNVDSLHHLTHPHYLSLDRKPTHHDILKDEDNSEPQLVPPIVELHGTLRHVTCLTCHSRFPRYKFQSQLARLNPAWADFLRNSQEQGAFSSTNAEGGIRANPDGDVDIPGASYSQFRYLPCPRCLNEGGVEVDKDGAHLPRKSFLSLSVSSPHRSTSGELATHNRTRGILKPNIIFFGENVQQGPRDNADKLLDEASSVLVIGSSLATYSAWKLVQRAAITGKGIGIINLGGVRRESEFFNDRSSKVAPRLRLDVPAAEVLIGAAEALSDVHITAPHGKLLRK